MTECVSHHPSPLSKGQQWTRERLLQQLDDKYFIQDRFEDSELLGWIIQTADTRDSLPQPEVTAHSLAIHEMHLMYWHTTDKVIKDDNLLALFNISETFWPRLRQAWQRDRHHMITDRIDFCMNTV